MAFMVDHRLLDWFIDLMILLICFYHR